MSFKTFPAEPGRWNDLASVMQGCEYGSKCWCAYWYLPNKDYKAGWGDKNRAVMANLVASGVEPGLIAYIDDRPVGWVGVAPRIAYDRLARSATFTPIDGVPVWSITCFIVAPGFRRHGLMSKLATAAADFAFSKGAPAVEAYPMVGAEKRNAADLFVGTVNAFRKAGFKEVAHPSPLRRVMRLEAPQQTREVG